jgi:hypothetical protein
MTTAYPIHKRAAGLLSFVRPPDEQGYGELERRFNLPGDQRPPLVAAPRTSAEVSETVRAASGGSGDRPWCLREPRRRRRTDRDSPRAREVLEMTPAEATRT